MITVAAVVKAIVRKLLVSGSATEKISCLTPMLNGDPGWDRTIAPIAVTANTSGGWTTGPNRFRLRTAHTARTHARM